MCLNGLSHTDRSVLGRAFQSCYLFRAAKCKPPGASPVTRCWGGSAFRDAFYSVEISKECAGARGEQVIGGDDQLLAAGQRRTFFGAVVVLQREDE